MHEEQVAEVFAPHDFVTHNGWYGMSWNVRFREINKHTVKLGFYSLKIDRKIWTAIASLDLKSGVLYVYTKEKNLEKVRKDFGSSNIHYFHALILKNCNSDQFLGQISFFSAVDDKCEYNLRREEEHRKILGDFYSKVKHVVFVVGEEERGKLINVSIKYYNTDFQLLEEKDVSDYMNIDYDDTYQDTIIAESTDNAQSLVHVKPSVKVRKESVLREKEQNDCSQAGE